MAQKGVFATCLSLLVGSKEKEMRIIHMEASPGWGGQEMRILKEALGLRSRAITLLFAIQKGGGLVEAARKEGLPSLRSGVS